MSPGRTRLLRYAFVAGCLSLFTVLWLDYRSFFFDDAFITFRYARNLADGFGPVFNLGERVEGYTTFAWMLVSSIPFALFGSAGAMQAIKGLGLALGLVAVWRVYTFPGPEGDRESRYSVVLLAASPVFVVNCGDGLETPLFTLLLLELCRAAVRPRAGGGGMVAGALLAGLTLTRPEAAPLLLAIPVALAAGGARPSMRWLAGFGGATVIPVGLHLVWRHAYYGALVPNTYYAKATGSLAARLDSGFADVLAFVLGKGNVLPFELWLAAALAALGTAAAFRSGGAETRAWHLVLWLGVGSRVAFDIWSGSEWMGVFRFLAPALPLLVVLAEQGRRHLARSLPATIALGCAFALAVGTSIYGHGERTESTSRYRYGLEQAHVGLGRWLEGRYPPDSWIAIGDSGAVPFYSRLRTIDMWGLVDGTVARLPGEYGFRPGTADYVLGRSPEVIVLWTPVPFLERPPDLVVRGVSDFDSAILAHPEFQRRYRFVREFTFRPEIGRRPGYYLAVFERGSPRQSSEAGSPPPSGTRSTSE